MDPIFTILAVLLAFVATILTFVFLVPEKKRASLNAFWRFIHDTVNFKYLIVEKILQAFYIFVTLYVFLSGFFMLIDIEKGPRVMILGLVVMILGPIMVRVVYELFMMAVLLIKNVIQINNKLRYPEETKNTPVAPIPTMPVVPAPVDPAPAEPVTEEEQKTFCTNCGNECPSPEGYCTNCGQKL